MVFFCVNGVDGQSIFSPYTSFGIGEFNEFAQAHQVGMGGVGIATLHPYHINHMNPSLLAYNRLSKFQMGLTIQSRNLEDEEASLSSTSSALNYLTFSWPIIFNNKKSDYKASINLGIQPLTTVNYKGVETQTVATDSVQVLQRNKGTGGLNRVYLGTGIKLISLDSGKLTVSVGGRVNYYFGEISRENSVVSPVRNPPPYSTTTTSTTNSNKFGFDIGLSIRKKLNSNKFLNLGLVYDLPLMVTGRHTNVVEYPRFVSDTLASERPSSTFIPGRLGLGLSYEIGNRWVLGMDYFIRGNSESDQGNDGTRFSTSSKLAIGVQLIPDVRSIKGYFLRSAYRVGVTFEEFPYSVDGEAPDDFGINFGSSLPLRSFSNLDIAFTVGRRGSISSSSIQERYFEIAFGVAICDRWFQRRKYD